MSDRRICLALAVAVLTLGSGAGRADDSRKEAAAELDDELLEFLGSVDPASDSAQPDDGTWIEYLSQTDIGKVVKPAGTAAGADAKPAASAAQSSVSGVTKHE
jgi:hypothetical protein